MTQRIPTKEVKGEPYSVSLYLVNWTLHLCALHCLRQTLFLLLRTFLLPSWLLPIVALLPGPPAEPSTAP